jgi:hypothetical protein
MFLYRYIYNKSPNLADLTRICSLSHQLALRFGLNRRINTKIDDKNLLANKLT